MSPRDRILARRAKFLAAAAAATVSAACSSSAEPCLRPLNDTGVADANADTADTRPQACLSPELDTSVADSTDASDTSVTDTGSTDTGPMPCLIPAADTGGD
jgi:hypothetical protein